MNLEINIGMCSLKLYQELFPVVIDTIKLLEENQNNFLKQDFLYKDTIQNLINILSNLSKGYNRFYSKDKCSFYASSRDCLSTVQSNIIIMSKLNLNLKKELLINIYNQLENNIKYYNGLLKKIEEK